MIVYRRVARPGRTSELSNGWGQRPAEADPLDHLVEIGEWEQAILDARYPAADGWAMADDQLAGLILEAAHRYLASIAPQSSARHIPPPVVSDEWNRPDWPAEITVNAPEGFVHYALDLSLIHI